MSVLGENILEATMSLDSSPGSRGSQHLFDDGQMVQLFNEPGPYYSSYPSLSEWRESGTDQDYRAALREFLQENSDAPLFLYLHIPYCAKLCWYCFCNIHISNNRERIQAFVNTLNLELENLERFFDQIGMRPNFREVHLGGGTPSHLDHAQLKSVIERVRSIVDVEQLAEFAMEIDPRTVDHADMEYYASLGVNRISFGVQDFDPSVQGKINRVQPFEMVENLLDTKTRSLFAGVNFDLLFGLPGQTPETFRRTVELTNSLAPERVAMIRYAHVPDVRKHIRMIDASELPAPELMPGMFEDGARGLMHEGGYQWVGIDHFAKPQDALAKASLEGQVGRNFGGSSTGRAEYTIGVGPTTTHAFGPHYFQSVYDLKQYRARVEANEFPIFKSFTLDLMNVARRDCMFSLQCRRELVFSEIESRYGIDFRATFGPTLERLKRYQDMGMIEIDQDGIRVTDDGRYFIRLYCREFDDYLENPLAYKIHGP
jgi:oxygen-independent coproporphyrinogen III oxidase